MEKSSGHAKRIKDHDGIDWERLTVDQLLELRDQVSNALANRVEAERRDLESRLARLKLADVTYPTRLAKGGRVIGMRAMVAPKYRNPDNPSETWSGRGRKPRWLTAALKAGKKLREFKIAMPLVSFVYAGGWDGLIEKIPLF
ncbi:MAG: H-NS histone family protein [Gammaproteobacteria bacterium]